jgi:CRISPR-associated protein Cst1
MICDGMSPAGNQISMQPVNTSSVQYSVSLTGDPFVDAGITAIELLSGKSWPDIRDDDFKKAADELVDLYLTPAWSKDLISLFPNSTYIQTSKNYNKKKKSQQFLYNLISGVNAAEKPSDFCIFCGSPAFKREDQSPFVKSQIPLVGSSTFTNYFPSFQNGISICARCALAFQFAPLVAYKAGGKPCIVSSSNPRVIQELGKEALHYIHEQQVLGAYSSKEVSGIYDEKFRSPQNALFHLAYKVTRLYRAKGISSEHEEITLYHTDNYNQNPKGIAIYTLPNNVFRFVALVMGSTEYRGLWFALLSRHYRTAKKEPDTLPVWKTSFNLIHDQLLKNQSILWAFKDDEKKTLTIPFVVIERYMELVRRMNRQRIEKIKYLADRLAECIEKSGDKKRVNALQSARDLVSFRNQLRLILKDWQKQGRDEPLIKFDDYIEVLIPGDYSGWTEVRDLIVIRLYEKLHPLLVKTADDDDTEDSSKKGEN